MKSRDFCFWLQGYFELLNNNDGALPILNTVQTQIVKRHLELVFKHEIDPGMGDKKEQAELNAIHHTSDPQFVVNPNLLMRC